MFGTELQGRESHEALLRLHDTEIRVLENIRQCMKMRIDSDRQYATGLQKMTQQAAKVDIAEFLDTSAFFRAWDTVLKQTDAFAVELKRTADEISQSLLETLTSVLAEKKRTTRVYADERARLEKEFLKLQEKVHQQKDEYGRCMDRVKQDRSKFKDIQTKGKTGPKLDEARSRQRKSMVRLHQVHNDYVISLRDLTSQQASYLGTTLPALLNSHQVAQESLVSLSKGILAEYVRLTDLSSERYRDMFALMAADVQRIAPDKEYTSSFIPKHRKKSMTPRTDLQVPAVLEFDERLLDDYSCLDPGQIAVDELCIDQLKARRDELKVELETQRMCLEDRTSAIEERLKEEEKLTEKAKMDPSLPALQALCEARRKRAQTQKEKAETEALVIRLRTVLELIEGPLKELGDNPPPTITELDPQDPDSISTTSGAESKPKKRGILTLPKSFARKATGAGSTLAGIFRNTSNDTADGEGSDDGKATPNDVSDSYEQHDPNNMDTNNGPSNRMSIDVMREQGMMKSADLPPIFEKLEDNEWFHGVLPREEVQRLLAKDGDYLVRESKNKKTNEVQYVLSVFWEGHKHFIIQGHEGSWRLEGSAFATIPQLVQYQHASGLAITNKSQAYLRSPVLREEWELMNDHINLNEKIGNGNFGEVYKGVYWPKNLVVAVKTCKDTLSEDQRKKFLEEGRILRQYNHPNIVQFIGIAAQRQPVMIVMEYVSGGALLQFLRKNGSRCTVRDLTRMCSDAACGMAYLEEKKCIHRDLAARNCLIGEDNMVKISDFGMSREEQVYTVSGGMKQIPIKWTAPEALNYGQYTCMCDVWSFGILMWEVFSLGKTPYPGMDNTTAKHRIEENYRMPPPNQTPSEVARLMSRCWEYKPEERPHFQEIYDILQGVLAKLGH